MSMKPQLPHDKSPGPDGWYVSPRIFVWSAQLTIFAVSGILAFLLLFEFRLGPQEWARLAYAIPIWVLVKALVFRFHRLDLGWWRYVSVPDVVRIGLGNLVGSILSAILILRMAPSGFPPAVYPLDLLICMLATAGIRVLARIMADAVVQSRRTSQTKPIFIYGAGTAGVGLLREIRTNPGLHYAVFGFIDDNPHKKGMYIHGVRVLGAGAELAPLVARHLIEEVLIAIPSASGPQISQILQRCHRAGVRCKTIPGLAEILSGSGLGAQIRDVAVEDLLGRNPIRLDESEIRAKLEDQVVLVTGAAGSIGSELCRQIARFRPRAIVGYEISETALFHLDHAMREAFPDVCFYPEIGNIQHPARLAEVLERYAPSVLYHAAAYKHVPMMETQVFEAVENNVLGTYNVAIAAAQYGVTDFVMISSDKAVRPTSIMGVTKRVAELLVNSLQNGGTNYVSVRFGNVLGSNGSVVPLFKLQIAKGGPVTVTHPEMRRYFMTMPEAAQLVLQASAMGKGGEIFVADMGQPVRILDVARNLILLSGLRPDQDIKIEFTGVRPGEKLYEELSTLEENTLPTYHERIKIFAGNGLPPDGMKRHIEALQRLCLTRDSRDLILELKELAPDYNPSTNVLRQWLVADRESLSGLREHSLGPRRLRA